MNLTWNPEAQKHLPSILLVGVKAIPATSLTKCPIRFS